MVVIRCGSKQVYHKKTGSQVPWTLLGQLASRGRNLLGKRPLLRLTGPDSASFSISFDRDGSSETQLQSEDCLHLGPADPHGLDNFGRPLVINYILPKVISRRDTSYEARIRRLIFQSGISDEGISLSSNNFGVVSFQTDYFSLSRMLG